MQVSPLPPDWTEQVSSRTKLTYWFNSRTGESTYTRPVEPDAPITKRARIEGPSDSSKREPDDGGAAAAAAVAGAYDHLVDAGIDGRRSSALLHLKNFNNWIKAVLIAEYAPRPCVRVLDLACGKLGDLAKWRLSGVREYCGVDISRTAIDDARTRFNTSNRGGALAARLARADLGAIDICAAGIVAPEETFDAVSIQFALHYMFRSEVRALTFFRNVASRLRPGGVFVGTIPDASVLVRRLREVRGPCREATHKGGSDVTFGNSLFSVTFPADTAERAAAGLGSHPYGCRYTFWLAEAVDRVDEYLVPWLLLQRLAAAAGLRPLAHDNFHAFYSRMAAIPHHSETARTMRVFNCEGSLTRDEWEVAGLYRVFAFRKEAEGNAAVSAQDAVVDLWEGGDTPAAYNGLLPSWNALGLAPLGATGAQTAPPPYAPFVRPEDIVDVGHHVAYAPLAS